MYWVMLCAEIQEMEKIEIIQALPGVSRKMVIEQDGEYRNRLGGECAEVHLEHKSYVWGVARGGVQEMSSTQPCVMMSNHFIWSNGVYGIAFMFCWNKLKKETRDITLYYLPQKTQVLNYLSVLAW